MIEARKWYQEQKVENTLTAFREKGIEAFYVPSKEDVISKLLDIIPSDALVGLGGSVTLREIGLPDALRDRGNRVADHWEAGQRGASAEEMMEIRRLHLNSDVFVTSTNAVTETGELINIDGGGQRVAAMIFGPGKVFVVAGVNKIVGDVDEGLWRAWNVAAPMNARRMNRKTPCAVSGACSDCDSEQRICNVTTIIHRRPSNTDLTIILVGENLGY